jgi:hypothetical protein
MGAVRVEERREESSLTSEKGQLITGGVSLVAHVFDVVPPWPRTLRRSHDMRPIIPPRNAGTRAKALGLTCACPKRGCGRATSGVGRVG